MGLTHVLCCRYSDVDDEVKGYRIIDKCLSVTDAKSDADYLSKLCPESEYCVFIHHRGDDRGAFIPLNTKRVKFYSKIGKSPWSEGDDDES